MASTMRQVEKLSKTRNMEIKLSGCLVTHESVATFFRFIAKRRLRTKEKPGPENTGRSHTYFRGTKSVTARSSMKAPNRENQLIKKGGTRSVLFDFLESRTNLNILTTIEI